MRMRPWSMIPTYVDRTIDRLESIRPRQWVISIYTHLNSLQLETARPSTLLANKCATGARLHLSCAPPCVEAWFTPPFNPDRTIEDCLVSKRRFAIFLSSRWNFSNPDPNIRSNRQHSFTPQTEKWLPVSGSISKCHHEPISTQWINLRMVYIVA